MINTAWSVHNTFWENYKKELAARLVCFGNHWLLICAYNSHRWLPLCGQCTALVVKTHDVSSCIQLHISYDFLQCISIVKTLTAISVACYFLKMAGFECDFVDKPPKAVQFECPICLLVLREPYQATCCGKSFCKECIEPLKANSQPCPTCSGTERFALFHNLGLQQSLYDFHVSCTHKSQGCEWTGELRELDNHLNSDPPADKSLQGCL